MPVGVGAGGHLGICRESVVNTYEAPEKFLRIRNENLNYVEDRIQTRPLKGHADVDSILPGNVRVEGDFELELKESDLAWLLYAMRGAVTKSGTTPNFVYTFVPNSAAEITSPQSTLSITVTRNGEGFGYVGCVIASVEITIDDGLAVATFGILGSDEESVAVPTPTYPEDEPFAVGQYDIQIPTSTSVTDVDTFAFSVNDGSEAQYRLKKTGRGAEFVKHGERAVMLTAERDFFDRTEYDDFKAKTSQSITVRMEKSATRYIEMLIPQATQDDHPISGLSGQADLIRSSISYMGVFNDATQKSYQIAVGTSEDIT